MNLEVRFGAVLHFFPYFIFLCDLVRFFVLFCFVLNRGAVKAHCGYLFGNSTCYLDIGMVHAYPMESPWAYLLSPVASEPIWPQTGCCSASRQSVAPPHRLPALLLLTSLLPKLAPPLVSTFQGWLQAENELPSSEMTFAKGGPWATPSSCFGA